MARHVSQGPKRRKLAVVAVLLAMLAVVGAFALVGNSEPAAAPAVTPVPPAAVPAPEPVHTEHHVQEAAATPVGEASEQASQRVTADRNTASSNVAAQVTQAQLNRALGGVPLMFKPDTATLTPQSETRLSAVAEVLRLNPSARVEIVGHTAVEISNPALCLQLSQLRAEAVAIWLSRNDIDPGRVPAVGVSHSQPQDSATDSRRVELVALAS